LDEVIEHAQSCQAAGAPDITVLGQNILAYGKASGERHPGFVELMETLLAKTTFPWITYLTSLASDLTDEICERVIAQPRITPLLHLPLQSGSDHVLEDMRRGYDVERFTRIVATARAVRPDLYLTTDLLVGFPTETEADFAATLQLVEQLGFDDAFMFAYSPRPGTYATRKYPDSLSRAEKLDRLSTLIAQQRAAAAQRNQRYLGQELEVIVEKRTDDGAVARTNFNKPVRLGAVQTRPGHYTRVRITQVRVTSFDGEEVQESAR
jgi:tRNA-2-methylthio-N6-dimethylallyladenosine synthase